MSAIVRGLFEAHLPVASLETSISFYRDRLGLAVARVFPERQAAFLWTGPVGGAMLGLWAAGFGPQRTTLHVAFAVALDDVVAAPRTLTNAGIPALDFDEQPTDEAVVIAWMPAAAVYFHDPDGHLLEYIAMLPEPQTDEGIVRWSAWRQAHDQTRRRSRRRPTRTVSRRRSAGQARNTSGTRGHS